jgi:hypothetical protein
MPATHAVEILQALGNLPHKTAHPIVMNLEQQLLGQQVRLQPEAASDGKAPSESTFRKAREFLDAQPAPERPSLDEMIGEIHGLADREVREAQQGETSLIQAA